MQRCCILPSLPAYLQCDGDAAQLARHELRLQRPHALRDGRVRGEVGPRQEGHALTMGRGGGKGRQRAWGAGRQGSLHQRPTRLRVEDADEGAVVQRVGHLRRNVARDVHLWEGRRRRSMMGGEGT